MNCTTKEKCPLGVCNGKGEYIIHHTCLNGNDLNMYPARTSDCGKKSNSLRGLRIHKACWCKRRNSPIGECKSNDGLMNQEHPHNVQEPITERQRPGDIPSKPRIQWPKGNHIIKWTNLDQELSFLLTTHLKGPIGQQMTSFCRIIYDACLEWFGAVTHKKDKTEYNILLNTLSVAKSCLVAPGVAVPPWATETVITPGWRLMRVGYRTCFHTLYDIYIYIYIYIYI